LQATNMDTSESYISVRQAAKRLGVSVTTIYEYVGANKLRFRRQGETVIIEEQSVHDLQLVEQEDEQAQTLQLPEQEEKQAQAPHELHLASGPVQVDEFVSVRDAAKILGVSARSVYGYIETGKLLGIRIGASIAVHAKDVHNYQRPAVGRPRERIPIWRVPVVMNLQYLTTIQVRVIEGQGEKLKQRLAEIRGGRKHMLAGTVARYVVRDLESPDEVQVVLVWRKLCMPPQEERREAVQALCQDLSDILDKDGMVYREGEVLLNA
jgi:excisionase family DNA binding protein